MKKRFSILLLLLTICFMTSHAQQMPITVTPILTPPYTPSLSKMCESGSTSLMVNVFVNDVTASDIQLRLHLKLESTGITIESVSKAPVRPISVGGGEARVLMGSDLADVLSLNNLTFKGYDKAAYIKTGALPGGVWRLTAWLEHYHTGRILSNKGTAMAVIASYPPPVLTSPKNNEVTTGDMSKPIVFTWNASKFMGGTSSLLYTLEMWEMHTDGVPAEAVVASQSPIYTSAPTAGQSHTLIPTSLAMEPGRKYCWRVTVSYPSGKAHIQNGGRSEVRVFQYLEKCPDICELNVTVRDVTATASWDVDTRHKGGWNVEMYDDAGTYHETLWTGNNNTGEQMFDYGTKWHVRVQGVCQGGQVSAWSEWKDFQIAEQFTTPKRDDGTPYECGEFAEPRVITNMEDKELKKGDIFENERGTTKYEIYSATKNDDGSYRGLSYIILSIWNCKVLGEYDNLRVNTDGVNISNFSWRSKKSDLLMADPDAIRQWTEELAKDIAGATYNNSIKEIIKLDDVSFETIVHKDGKYYAIVKTETGEIEEVDITYSVDGKKRVAIEDKDGKQLVVDKNGEMMGVEEYKYCGGSKLLLNENMKEKDAKVARSGNVYFSLYGDDYLFDSYEKYKKHSAADGYAKRFPSIGEGDYRPAYACAESNTEIQLKAEPYKTYTFKNERGVPVVCKDGILTISARGDRDTTSVYAYDYDGNIVGKVNVLSYDKLTRKICLVPVGESSSTDAARMKAGLDEIFAKLMVDYEVTIGDVINIEYSNGKRFTHGGSGRIGVYNDDQESAIDKLKNTIKIDDETCYLFMVKEADQFNDDDTQTSVGGYMPRGYQFGFIYKELNNSKTVAHELSHGAFHLRHTFDTNDFLAPEGSTDNLMDYADADDNNLNHWQWQDIHQPKSVRFKWAQDEQDAEWTTDGHYYLFTYLGMLMGMDYSAAEMLGRYAEKPDTWVVSESDFEERDYTLPNDKKIHLYPRQVVMGEDEIVTIPKDYVAGDMLENTTWLLGGYQQRNHALTGGFHGVELAATVYAIKNRETLGMNSDYSHYLLHRFGDCFAHFSVKYDMVSYLRKYVDDNFTFVSANTQVMDNRGTRPIGEKNIIKMGNGKYMTSYSRDEIYSQSLNENNDLWNNAKKNMTANYRDDDVDYFINIPLTKYVNAIDDYIAKNFVNWGRSFISSKGSVHPELDKIYYKPDGKYWYTYTPNELKRRIIMSVINAEDFDSQLSINKIRNGILNCLDDVAQNRYQMYGDDINCIAFTLGHASDDGLPDDILRRPKLFKAYAASSLELIEMIMNKNDEKRKKNAIEKLDKIIKWGVEYKISEGSKLSSVFAFLIALERASLSAKSSDVITLNYPIKHLPIALRGLFTKANYYYEYKLAQSTFLDDANNENDVMKTFISTCIDFIGFKDSRVKITPHTTNGYLKVSVYKAH